MAQNFPTELGKCYFGNLDSKLNSYPFVLVSNATFIIIILGKYGKILKVAVNQSTAYAGTQVSFFIRDEFRKKTINRKT